MPLKVSLTVQISHPASFFLPPCLPADCSTTVNTMKETKPSKEKIPAPGDFLYLHVPASCLSGEEATKAIWVGSNRDRCLWVSFHHSALPEENNLSGSQHRLKHLSCDDRDTALGNPFRTQALKCELAHCHFPCMQLEKLFESQVF